MQEFAANYLNTLGLGGLLVGLFIEAMGLPFPGGIMVMLAGFFINQERLNFYAVFLLAMLGFNLGAATAFFIGRQVGEPLFERYGKYLGVKQYNLEQARQSMQRSAPLFIIAGRFIPMLSNLTPYLAGASKLKWGQFIFYNLIFTVIWVAMNLSIGIFFGHKWPQIAGYLNNKLPLAVLALVAVYLTIKFLIKQFYLTRSEKL
ncbi:MAG: DedA family protein [Firmicutes bacterium]|nr:DedA family protein [Bacillota bacterium]